MNLASHHRNRLLDLSRDLAGQQDLLRLFDEVTELSERLLTLTHSLNHATSLDDVFTLLAAPALSNGAHYASLYVLEGEGSSGKLICRAHMGAAPNSIPPGSPYPLLDIPLMAYWSGDNSRVLVIEDTSQHPLIDAETLRHMHAAHMIALVAIPLLSSEQWVGAVTLVWDEAHTFSLLEQAYYTHLATLLASTVTNLQTRARLEQMVAERAQSLDAVIAELEQNTRTLDGILNATSQHFTLLDRDLRILYVNQPAARMLKDLPNREALYGLSLHEIAQFARYELDKDPIVEERLREVIASGVKDQFETVIKVDGKAYNYHVIFSPIFDADGKVVAVVANGQDISEQRATERATLQISIERERKDLLARLMRGAGHAFRNPLAVINTKLYLLERSEDPARRQQHLAELAEQAQDILGLVEKLHTLARMEDATMYPVGAVNLGALINMVPWTFADRLRRKSHRLNIISVDPSLQVSANPELLEMAFFNLVDNAIRYTPAEGEISVTATQVGDQVVVSVHDSGPGIPEDQQAAVFEYFHWQDVPGAAHGHGLGLSMARHIARLYSGDVTLVSAPGQGTTVTMTLPVADSSP